MPSRAHIDTLNRKTPVPDQTASQQAEAENENLRARLKRMILEQPEDFLDALLNEMDQRQKWHAEAFCRLREEVERLKHHSHAANGEPVVPLRLGLGSVREGLTQGTQRFERWERFMREHT